MSRTKSAFAMAALLVALPAPLLAGGPPWLSIPIDGVTAENAAVCGALLTDKLEAQLYRRGLPQLQVEMQEHQGQWYMTTYMASDLGLKEVEAALAGSGFTVPRNRLQLWGDVVLQIDSRSRLPLDLISELEKNVAYASVAKVETTPEGLLVTMNMPYPVDLSRALGERDAFTFAHFAADPAKRSLPQATARMLPSYTGFRDVIASHDAALKDIRWSMQYHCRPVGCVAVPAEAPGSKHVTATLPE